MTLGSTFIKTLHNIYMCTQVAMIAVGNKHKHCVLFLQTLNWVALLYFPILHYMTDDKHRLDHRILLLTLIALPRPWNTPGLACQCVISVTTDHKICVSPLMMEALSHVWPGNWSGVLTLTLCACPIVQHFNTIFILRIYNYILKHILWYSIVNTYLHWHLHI